MSVAIFGEGLPQLEESQKPPQHPEDLGGVILATTTSEDFFEPFTQTNYWGRQNFDIELPQTGTYYIVVWHPEGVPGKYVMDTGTAEVFGPGDIFNFPVWWVQVHVFFGHGPYLIAGLLTILSLIFAPGLIRRWQATSPALSSGGA